MTDRDQDQGLRFAGLGIEFAASVAGLTLAGYWIDRHYDSGPWGVLVGAGIGLIGGTYNLIRAALAANPPKDKTGSKPADGPGQEDGR